MKQVTKWLVFAAFITLEKSSATATIRIDEVLKDHQQYKLLEGFTFSQYPMPQNSHLPPEIKDYEFTQSTIYTRENYQSSLIIYAPGIGPHFSSITELQPGTRVRFVVCFEYLDTQLKILNGETIESYQGVDHLSKRIGEVYKTTASKIPGIRDMRFKHFTLSEVRLNSLMSSDFVGSPGMLEAFTVAEIPESDTQSKSLEELMNKMSCFISDGRIKDPEHREDPTALPTLWSVDMYILQHKVHRNPVGRFTMAVRQNLAALNAYVAIERHEEDMNQVIRHSYTAIKGLGSMGQVFFHTPLILIPLGNPDGDLKVSYPWEYLVGVRELMLMCDQKLAKTLIAFGASWLDTSSSPATASTPTTATNPVILYFSPNLLHGLKDACLRAKEDNFMVRGLGDSNLLEHIESMIKECKREPVGTRLYMDSDGVFANTNQDWERLSKKLVRCDELSFKETIGTRKVYKLWCIKRARKKWDFALEFASEHSATHIISNTETTQSSPSVTLPDTIKPEVQDLTFLLEVQNEAKEDDRSRRPHYTPAFKLSNPNNPDMEQTCISELNWLGNWTENKKFTNFLRTAFKGTPVVLGFHEPYKYRLLSELAEALKNQDGIHVHWPTKDKCGASADVRMVAYTVEQNVHLYFIGGKKNSVLT